MATSPAPESVHVRWRVVPLATPRVVRRCSQCNEVARFASSDRFRLNAQQRRVDVWLIYRCERCSNTWNRPLFERALPEAIGAELYQRLLCNDSTTAWDIAFDIEELRGFGLHIDAGVPLQIEATKLTASTGMLCCVELQVPYPCNVRLDRFIAQALGLSRSTIQRDYADGAIAVRPDDGDALRRPIRNGQLLLLRRKE